MNPKSQLEDQVPVGIRRQNFAKSFLGTDDFATKARAIVPTNVSGTPEPPPPTPCAGLRDNG